MANEVKVMDLSADCFDQKTYSLKFERIEVSTNVDLCLICHGSQTVSKAKQLISEYFNWSRDVGVESDSLSCLDTNLLPVFVLRRVLNFPKTECAKIFLATLGAVNPADWFLLCESCLQLINQVYLLEKELEGLKLKVRKRLKTSVSAKVEELERAVGSGGVLNIREIIRDFFKGNVSHEETDNHQIEQDDSNAEDLFKNPSYSSNMCSSSGIEDSDENLEEKKSISLTAAKTFSKRMICNEQLLETATSNKQKRTFRCPDCSEVFYSSGKKLNEHRTAVHGAFSSFNCEICSTYHLTTADLKEHVYQAHGSKKIPHRCKICDKVLVSKRGYIDHMNTVHSDELRYTCEVCGFTTKAKRSMRRHKKIHDNKKSLPKSTKNYFANSAQVAEPQTKAPEDPKGPSSSASVPPPDVAIHRELSSSFKCEICFKCFPTKPELKGHVLEAHQSTTIPHRCEICDKVLSSKGNYTDHVKMVHSEEKSFICEICGFSTKLSSHLKKHKKTHDKKFVCTYCGRKFTNHYQLNNHVASHTGEVIVCDECGRQFHARRYLLRHILKYHKRDNGPPVKPQKIAKKSNLNKINDMKV